MATQDSNVDIAALTRQVNELQAQVDSALTRLRKRRKTMRIALIALALVMAGYFSLIYVKLAALVDAPTVVQLAVQQVEPSLNTAGSQLSARLKEAAPGLIANVEKSLLALPDQLAQKGRTRLNDELKQHLPVIEEELYTTLRDVLVLAKAKAVEQGINPDDPAAVDALAQSVGPMVHDRAKQAIDDFYHRYAASADILIDYFHQLSENNKLDQRQQYHREILSLTLALMAQQFDANAPAAGGAQ